MTALTYPERVETVYTIAYAMLDLGFPAVEVARYLEDALWNARYEARRDEAKAATS